MAKPVIVKKSPVVIVKNFILLQLGAIVVFFILSVLANYAAIYRSLVFSHAISFRIAEAVFIFSSETVIVFFIFFRWYKEYYHIKNNEIIHAYGILYRHRTTIPLDNIVSVSHRQGPLGKLTKYGTIELISSNISKKILLKNIPTPEEYADLILKFSVRGRKSKNTEEASPVLAKFLNSGEHENLEFKSTFRWDMRQNTVNHILEKSAMKTIAAFLNSQGGHLVIGVDDNKAVVGLASDYGSLIKKDADGFENHFTQIFRNMIGAEFRQFVKLNWSQLDGKECCVVSIAPSHKPVYLKENNTEEFYIRTGNGTTALKLSEANAYIDSRRLRLG